MPNPKEHIYLVKLNGLVHPNHVLERFTPTNARLVFIVLDVCMQCIANPSHTTHLSVLVYLRQCYWFLRACSHRVQQAEW